MREIITTSGLKEAIKASVDTQHTELVKLSLQIHANPELGFQEIKASELLTAYLENHGFTVERGICDMATAFRAACGQGSPVIALLAEYDALPEVGHACGHNIIAAAAAGAAVAAKRVISKFPGTILVLGTPAEELYGGKITMVEHGIFKDIDAVMMVHPGVADTATTEALACISLDIEFFGKAAHAAANPEAGVNALEAMIVSFNAINSLRQHIASSARIHGIITRGGEAANVVPAYSAGTFLIRAKDDSYLDELKEKVLNCFAGAAQATGARLEYRWGNNRYAAMRNNITLAHTYSLNMESMGRHVVTEEPRRAFGSTDMGNVSQIVPCIHAFVAIAPPDVTSHSLEFAQAAASEKGMRAMLDAAKALAMTVSDLLVDPDLVKNVKTEFSKNG